MKTLEFNRRSALLCVAAAAVAAVSPGAAWAASDTVRLSDEEWQKRLGADRYAVLRKHSTEPPGSSPLDHEKHAGTFVCAGCALPLFASSTKFDSGTGWPSFWKPLPNAIATKTDFEMIEKRTEVHCRRCEGHLGHVFDDGPPPTHLRYCMNGLALRFKAA